MGIHRSRSIAHHHRTEATVPGHVGHACRYAQPPAPQDRGCVARVPVLGTARPGGSVAGASEAAGEDGRF